MPKLQKRDVYIISTPNLMPNHFHIQQKTDDLEVVIVLLDDTICARFIASLSMTTPRCNNASEHKMAASATAAVSVASVH